MRMEMGMGMRGKQMTLHQGKRTNRAKIAHLYPHMFHDQLYHLKLAQQIGGQGHGKVARQTRVIMAIDANGKSRK